MRLREYRHEEMAAAFCSALQHHCQADSESTVIMMTADELGALIRLIIRKADAINSGQDQNF